MPAASPGPAPAGFMWIEDASEVLGVKVGTLHKWRYRKVGPLAVRHAGRLMYAETAITAYLNGLVSQAEFDRQTRVPRPHVRRQPLAA